MRISALSTFHSWTCLSLKTGKWAGARTVPAEAEWGWASEPGPHPLQRSESRAVAPVRGAELQPQPGLAVSFQWCLREHDVLEHSLLTYGKYCFVLSSADQLLYSQQEVGKEGERHQGTDLPSKGGQILEWTWLVPMVSKAWAKERHNKSAVAISGYGGGEECWGCKQSQCKARSTTRLKLENSHNSSSCDM